MNQEQMNLYLDFNTLLGCSVTWDGYSMRSERASIYEQDSGIIVKTDAHYVYVRDAHNAIHWMDKTWLAGCVTDRRIKDILYKQEAAYRQLQKLNDRTPHDIYALIDPRDNTVCYVGMSMDVELRYSHHINCSGDNYLKIRWIQELQSQGLQPRLSILESVKGRHTAFQREQYWIKFYLQQGAQLTNLDAQWLTEWLKQRGEAS